MYRFTKIKNNHDRLRDDVIDCFYCSPIEVGEPVELISLSSSVIGAVRYVGTSPVVAIQKINEFTVQVNTRSGSIYQIETIKEPLDVREDTSAGSSITY